MKLRVARAGLALALALGTVSLGAWEQLRLPWVFSDEPDLNADFGFAPLANGRTRVSLDLGGRFAGFGLASEAKRAPQLTVAAEFTAPGSLESKPLRVQVLLDLADTLAEYGMTFSRSQFESSSTYVYKTQMSVDLLPGDYNVSISLKDAGLSIDSYRTLHLIVPSMNSTHWAVDDLKFITAVGKRLDAKGRVQRVLDPNPWRQVGGKLGWDLLVAYNDRGPRPGGKLMRRCTLRRLRGNSLPVYQEEGLAPEKKAQQVWLLRVPEAKVRAWSAGVYLLKVELWVGSVKTEASKTFEVLP